MMNDNDNMNDANHGDENGHDSSSSSSSIMEEDFLDAVEQHSNHEDEDDDDDEEMSTLLRTQDEDDESSSPSSASSSSNHPLGNGSRPRDRHSYLPGPSHPLLHDTRIMASSQNAGVDHTTRESSSPFQSQAATAGALQQRQLPTTTPPSTILEQQQPQQQPQQELPILELPGMVLFPGCTIPIRLQNRSWIQHLGRQIDASRRVGSRDFGQTVQLGILTHEQDDYLSLRSAARNQHQLANNNNNNNNDNNNDNNQGRRRSSLLRRGVRGNSRLQQRLSRILQLEILGDIVDNDNDNDDDDDDSTASSSSSSRSSNAMNRSHRRRRNLNLHPFIGRIGTIATITCTHGDAVLDQTSAASTTTTTRTNSNRNSSTTATTASSNSSVWQQHAENQRELILQAVGTCRFQVQSYLEFQSFADVQVFSVQALEHDSLSLQRPPNHWMTAVIPRRLPYDSSRIETDETVLHTTNNQDGEGDDDAGYDTSNASISASASSNRGSSHHRQRQRRTGKTNNVMNTKFFVSHHESLIRQLSMVTPTSHLVYQQVWPWRLVGQMVETIQRHGRKRNSHTNNSDSSNNNLLSSLAELLQDRDTSLLMNDPTRFSFWMASNMPLSIQDKLQLLKIRSTVERLKLLQKHLATYTPKRDNDNARRPPCAICCSTCDIPLSNVDCVFTVGGADGTTGNYVNEHGFIHQVVTLRQIDEDEVFCVGRASTENSYFPGYSWTVTYCRRCGALLGWKFHWVGVSVGGGDGGVVRLTRRDSDKNRPKYFFGFMSSSLITQQTLI